MNDKTIIVENNKLRLRIAELEAERDRLKAIVERLGSSEAFDVARSLDERDDELRMRMDYARRAISDPSEKTP